MGGYGGYVWTAFGLAALVLGGLLISSLVTLRRREREAKSLEDARARSPRNRRPRKAAPPAS